MKKKKKKKNAPETPESLRRDLSPAWPPPPSGALFLALSGAPWALAPRFPAFDPPQAAFFLPLGFGPQKGPKMGPFGAQNGPLFGPFFGPFGAFGPEGAETEGQISPPFGGPQGPQTGPQKRAIFGPVFSVGFGVPGASRLGPSFSPSLLGFASVALRPGSGLACFGRFFVSFRAFSAPPPSWVFPPLLFLGPGFPGAPKGPKRGPFSGPFSGPSRPSAGTIGGLPGLWASGPDPPWGPKKGPKRAPFWGSFPGFAGTIGRLPGLGGLWLGPPPGLSLGSSGPLFGSFLASFSLGFGCLFWAAFLACFPLWGVVWASFGSLFWACFGPLFGSFLGRLRRPEALGFSTVSRDLVGFRVKSPFGRPRRPKWVKVGQTALSGTKGKRESGSSLGYVALLALQRHARHSQLGSFACHRHELASRTNARYHLQRHASLALLACLCSLWLLDSC